MATDKLFHEYAVHFPRALAKVIHADEEEYVAKSLVLKETEKRADHFFVSQTSEHVILLENHGYDDEELYYRMIKTMVLFCTQFKFRGRMEAAVIFMEESNRRAAETFYRQFDQSAVLQFTPRIVVLGEMKVEELIQLGDVYLTPLYPLCDLSPVEIEARAPTWAEQIKTAPRLQDDERRNLLTLVGGFISHRNKKLTSDDLTRILGGFIMEDTQVGRDIMRIGVQRMLLKQIAARFGEVPVDVRQKIQMIKENDELDRIATSLFKIQNLDELEALVH